MAKIGKDELRIGMICLAPIKREHEDTTRREYEEVEIRWIADDGTVVEVATTSLKRKLVQQAVARSCLTSDLTLHGRRVVI